MTQNEIDEITSLYNKGGILKHILKSRGLNYSDYRISLRLIGDADFRLKELINKNIILISESESRLINLASNYKNLNNQEKKEYDNLLAFLPGACVYEKCYVPSN